MSSALSGPGATQVRPVLDAERDANAASRAPLTDLDRLAREAAEATAENRQLRLTVEALREELERQRLAEQARLDHAVAEVQDDNRQLQLTVQAVRDELERLRIASQERLDQALARADDENRQLRQTVQTLRDEMDRLRIAADERAMQHRRELADAQAHIQALRDQFEVLRARHAR